MSPSVPNMSMTAKIVHKEGLMFKSSPIFKDLEKVAKEQTESLTREKFKDELKDLKQDDKDSKGRRKQNKDPSIPEMRKTIQNMIFYFEKQCEKQMPTAYPLPGVAGDPKEGCSSYDEDRKIERKRKRK
jgi:hypothetical protein